ncbi:MAG TPA: cytochrome c-type biogenesis protein CcmH [Acidobacteriaceae bacterium]|nr:cytochrome c-type biogenesis protein CcmH [Acidobacteriaceae bacterium]
MIALRCYTRIFDRSLFKIWAQLSVACLLLLFMAGASNTFDRYQQLGHHSLICTCGCGQILLECNHVGCTVSTQEEAELRTAIARGDSNQLILQDFVQKYGPTVLAAPPERGFDLVAWIAPGVVFLLAMFAAALVIRKWKLHTVAMPAEMATDPHTTAILDKVRKETEL